MLIIPALATACENGAPSLVDAGSPEINARVALGEPITIATFNAFAGELPESIAVDGFGNIYVAMAAMGEIWKLDQSGSFIEVAATFAKAPGPFGVSGLRFDRKGNLYAVNTAGHADAHGVWKIARNGEKHRIEGTSNIPLPNDVAISPDGTIYITDSATGAIWRALRMGPAEMWVQDESLEGTGAYGLGIPIGVNGIAIVPGGLVVSNAEKGQVVKIPILPDGSAGQPMVLTSEPSLFGLDGIRVDARGTIYGAVNAGNRIVRISSDGSDVSDVLVGGPLDFPAGLAFGAGPDRHTLFIVNFSVIHFLHDPPAPADAHPAVIALRVGAPGISGR